MIHFYLLFLFCLSYPLFAQDSTGVTNLLQGDKAQKEVPLNVFTSSFVLQQLQKETVLLSDSIVDPNQFALSVVKIIEGTEDWSDPFSPGKIFHNCSSFMLSIKCYWSLLRLDRLLGKEKILDVQGISDLMSAKNFKGEIQRVMLFRNDNLDMAIWLLLFSIEFYDWAVEKEVPNPERLFPLTDDLVRVLFDDQYRVFNYSNSPFFLYILHRYYLKRGMEEERVQIADYIKKLYLHRNDGSEMDLQGAAICDIVKVAGIHKDYLKENDLLFPDYKEFEERIASEDIQRVQDCKKRYQAFTKNIDQDEKDEAFLGMERIAVIDHYRWSLFALYKVFGKDAVRHFVRHNPLLYKIQVHPFNKDNIFEWAGIYWMYISMATILKDVYEDDIEWQAEWQSVIDSYKAELSKNLLAIYSVEALADFIHFKHFTKLSLLLEQE